MYIYIFIFSSKIVSPLGWVDWNVFFACLSWPNLQVVTQLKLQVDSQSTESQHLRGAVAPQVAMASAVAPHVAWQKVVGAGHRKQKPEKLTW